MDKMNLDARGARHPVRDTYQDAIGRRRDELITPALLLDLSILRSNIDAMSAWARDRVYVRPHAKTPKCVEIARLQIAAGAIGITTATVWEAITMLRAGIDDVLIANEVVGGEKIALLADAARIGQVTVAVDDGRNAEQLSAAATSAGAEIGVLVDVDVGLRRGGVRTLEAARAVAGSITRLPGLRLRGVMGYEGHVVTEPDRELRAWKAAQAMEQLMTYVDQLQGDGFSIDIVSAGGTNTFDMTGAHPRVTEIQVGSYALMDMAYAPLTPAFRPALTILATVVSRQGTTAVLDCGTKVVAVDMALPRPPDGCGSVREIHEEHLLLDMPEAGRLALGERVELVVGFCGGTVNLHDVYHVVMGHEVVDVWPIIARGPGRSLSYE